MSIAGGRGREPIVARAREPPIVLVICCLFRFPRRTESSKELNTRRRFSAESGYPMRKVLSIFLFLVSGFVLLSGIAFSQGGTLRPLPVAATGLPRVLTAESADQADLERAGYILESRGGELRSVDRWERSYTFRGPSGSSAILVDNEYPTVISLSREIVFDITFSTKEGRSPADMDGIAPRLVAAMRRVLREDAAVVAGLGYLATAAGSSVAPEMLQAAVLDYLQEYRQPATPIQQECESCGWRDGFGDEYLGSTDLNAPLSVGGSDWKIAGIRHYRNGDSTFRLHITAGIPRRSS